MRNIVDDIDDIACVRIHICQEPMVIVLHLDGMTRKFNALDVSEK